MGESTPPPSGGQSNPKQAIANLGEAWNKVRRRATAIGSIAALFLFLVGAGGAAGYFYAQSKKPAKPTKTTPVQTLSQDDINKLSEVGANLGATGQTLNIGANALFRGKADVTGDLSIGGKLNANGPVTLSQLNISGNTAASGLNVGSNLLVSGTTTLQNTLSVAALATFNGGLNSSGNSSFNTLNANTIAVRTISISGALSISHLVTQGSTPGFSGGNALGGGGTASISGNDTSGTINFNIGSAAPAGTLGTVTFKAAYGSTPHVIISPITGAAASTPAYVTRTLTGFVVRTDASPATGTLTYDYIVTQ
jgi:hypothetical protein